MFVATHIVSGNKERLFLHLPNTSSFQQQDLNILGLTNKTITLYVDTLQDSLWRPYLNKLTKNVSYCIFILTMQTMYVERNTGAPSHKHCCIGNATMRCVLLIYM